MAAPRYAVSFTVDAAFERLVSRRTLGILARRVLRAEGIDGVGLSVAVTEDEVVRDLNQRYRGVDRTTDVLSFALDGEGEFPTPRGSGRVLGEVVISYPTAERQAHRAGHDISDELSHLLVHGLLHILGYDHESARDARLMRAREEDFLGSKAH